MFFFSSLIIKLNTYIAYNNIIIYFFLFFCLLQAAKRGQRESDLERIQDLFPNDCLRLYDADALTMVSALRLIVLHLSNPKGGGRKYISAVSESVGIVVGIRYTCCIIVYVRGAL